jgi:hypothetical protein
MFSEADANDDYFDYYRGYHAVLGANRMAALT